MSVGAGIALVVIGAILAFAVDVQVPYVDLTLVGYILMGAGVVIFLLGLILMARRRTTETVTRQDDGYGHDRVTRQRTSESGDDRV